MLRDAAEMLAPAVDETIAALTPTAADTAAVKLAQRYAAAIDDAGHAQELARKALAELGDDDVMTRSHIECLAAKVEAKELLDKLGPKLLATLESLGATPQARARLKEGGGPGGKPNRLAQLRAARPA